MKTKIEAKKQADLFANELKCLKTGVIDVKCLSRVSQGMLFGQERDFCNTNFEKRPVNGRIG